MVPVPMLLITLMCVCRSMSPGSMAPEKFIIYLQSLPARKSIPLRCFMRKKK